jgi:hypothetical protein
VIPKEWEHEVLETVSVSLHCSGVKPLCLLLKEFARDVPKRVGTRLLIRSSSGAWIGSRCHKSPQIFATITGELQRHIRIDAQAQHFFASVKSITHPPAATTFGVYQKKQPSPVA